MASRTWVRPQLISHHIEIDSMFAINARSEDSIRSQKSKSRHYLPKCLVFVSLPNPRHLKVTISEVCRLWTG